MTFVWTLVLALSPPAPPLAPGSTMVLRDVVVASFTASGDAATFPPSTRSNIAGVFSQYTGVATNSIYVGVEDDTTDVVLVEVEHTPPDGTTPETITSTLNTGIMRSGQVLQGALSSAGVVVVSLGTVSIVQKPRVGVPGEPPPEAFTQTTIIVIAVAGVAGLFLLIFIARQCDPERLRETTKLAVNVLQRNPIPGIGGGGGGGAVRRWTACSNQNSGVLHACHCRRRRYGSPDTFRS